MFSNKDNKSNLTIYIIIIIFIILLIYYNSDDLKINMIVLLTLKRGIISQNCFWWKINDHIYDTTGYELYSKLKLQNRFVKLNILGKKIYLLTDINDIIKLLDLSPFIFGPGKFKKKFFDKFMPHNVGISVNKEWIERRKYNNKVLEVDKTHQYNNIFKSYIEYILRKNNPKNFNEFTEATKKITSKIIFGTYEYNPIIYKVFKQVDSISSAISNNNNINSNDLQKYKEYITYELKNPKLYTLLELANLYHKMIPLESVIDQIPHWIFPIAGIFSVHLPRLLVLLSNHPEKLKIVIDDINNKNYEYKNNYIRKCILELFRLNNAVNSTFRNLNESFKFDNSDIIFEKGTEFVFFNNPMLRDLFNLQHQFIPERWNTELENNYISLMFNQGNQRCPGKELTISLLTNALIVYLDINENKINTNIKIDKLFIPYIINPCTIIIN